MKKRLALLFLLYGLLCCTACEDNNTEMETIVDGDFGEGAPSRETIDLDNSQEYSIGDTIMIVSDTVSYELTIDAVTYIEAENEHAEAPKHVILVDYTYKNNMEELLLIGDMRFQLATAENDYVYEPYYFDTLVTAEPAEKDAVVSAQVAYAQDDNNKEFILIYRDTLDSGIEPIPIKIDKIEEKN